MFRVHVNICYCCEKKKQKQNKNHQKIFSIILIQKSSKSKNFNNALKSNTIGQIKKKNCNKILNDYLHHLYLSLRKLFFYKVSSKILKNKYNLNLCLNNELTQLECIKLGQ